MSPSASSSIPVLRVKNTKFLHGNPVFLGQVLNLKFFKIISSFIGDDFNDFFEDSSII